MSASAKAFKFAEYVANKYRNKIYYITANGTNVETEDAECDVSFVSEESPEQLKGKSVFSVQKSAE